MSPEVAPCNASVINNIPRGKSPRKPALKYSRKDEKGFSYRDIWFPVLSKNSELDLSFMKKICQLIIDDALAMSSRVFAVRYDFFTPEYSRNNQVMSDFLRVFKREFGKLYPESFFGYCWVREKTDTSSTQHYHAVFLFNGHKIKSAYKLNLLAESCWKNVSQGRYWCPENQTYLVKRDDFESLRKLIRRCCYFAKKETKEIDSSVRRVSQGMVKPAGQRKSRGRVRSTSKCPSPAMSATDVRTAHRGPLAPETSPALLDSVFTQGVWPSSVCAVSEQQLHEPVASADPQDSMPPIADAILQAVAQVQVNDALKESVKRNAKQNSVKSASKSKTKWSAVAELVSSASHPALAHTKAHRHNFLFEAFTEGVSPAEYRERYGLTAQQFRDYTRDLQVSSIRKLFWAKHRMQWAQSSLSLDEYMAIHQLKTADAKRQLRRKPMSAEWQTHAERYYRDYWPQGVSVAAYAKLHNVPITSLRRYVVNFSQGLITPSILLRWM
ncbi:inovirus-type Gp2 protein [Plesiomonas shigelloides]|uniref:YagK/YfjJ domain-containing protein n=1 Tax=Plesiomonas shigelloides TaxID=703 RepID=UPI002247FE9D|nr:inovirus-type Gp2 protein [Plesiomonas shigelloides]MCX2534793.1 inovirus-type Gp2 protein [Plesiomonas shigelloides]